MEGVSFNITDDLIKGLGLSTDASKTGHYILQDDQFDFSHSAIDGLEILPLSYALKKYDWVNKNYFWKAIQKTNSRTDQPNDLNGYFIYVHKNKKIPYLCQTALLLLTPEITQVPHNIIVLDDGAELNLITGCASGASVHHSLHISFSEIYIGKHATLTHNMMHKWNDEVQTESQSAAIVGEGSSFICNHVVMCSAQKLFSNPKTWLVGKNASAKYNTVILSESMTEADLGGEVYLNAENTSAELIHRAVCSGGNVVQRGLLIGNAKCKAHVDCGGMVLNSDLAGTIESIPGLKAVHPEAHMSHEASIGKISPNQVEYLRCRGIGEMEAISMIIRGFIDSGIKGLGPEIDNFIADIVGIAGHGEKR